MWWMVLHGQCILSGSRDCQSLSHVQLFETPWTAAHEASPSFTIPQSFSNSCPLSQWCHPTISSSVVPSPPAPNPSQHQGNTEYSAVIKRRDQKQNYTTPMCHWRLFLFCYMHSFIHFIFQVPYRSDNSYLSFSFWLTSLKHNIL